MSDIILHDGDIMYIYMEDGEVKIADQYYEYRRDLTPEDALLISTELYRVARSFAKRGAEESDA